MVGTAMVVQGMAVGFVGTDQLVAQMGTGKEMVVVIVKLVVSVLELVALTGTDEEMVFFLYILLQWFHFLKIS
ncbi:hypothetical protein DPMN_172374 [Dreissena polymorpha]|uniref:Uncharacterized protein n=1 Tax=Dreissena polymorpha TaxID=45954 RepID=A0A9D4E2T5_DREPO|nr:hypothetical protein DPMN_172374 [Dreissena polymorpha]